jgi:N-acetylmuramoyl-L-alanine amidase
MIVKKLLFYIVIHFLISASFLSAQSHHLEIISINNISYISLNSFIQDLNLRSKFFDDNKKVIIYHRKNRIVLSGESSFFLINDDIFHLYTHVIYDRDDFFVPVKSFIKHLKNQHLFDNLHLNSTEQLLIIDTPQYNITHYEILERGNGFSISMNTGKTFDEDLIASWITDNNWLSLSIPGGIIDSIALKEIIIKSPIVEIKTVQMENASQISFLLNIIPDDFELSSIDNKIMINLYTAQKLNAKKIKEEKQKYIIDTIVLDAGHGGKDPGACVQSCQIQEKHITLAIVKKIGLELEKLGMNVIYTREDDRFVTLNQRANIANSNNGDLFISIHVNSISNSPRTKGFETYLLRIGKTEDAIKEVEKRENSVIDRYEASSLLYQKLSKINATIIQDANAKQSINLANHIQQQLALSINDKLDRGVKQAGFQVLWGVTMPNVLVEVGFITNKDERKNLTSKNYQTKISKSIIKAIKLYKNQYEQYIIE